MKTNKLIALIALLASAVFGAAAQNGTVSPYSGYGYGLLRDAATSIQRSMGGVGYAMNSGRQINAMNPASYAAIDSLTFLFDMGVNLDLLWNSEKQSSGTVSDRNTSGGLDYVTMQFPLGRYMGGSVGLVPFSSVGYSFGTSINNGFDSRQGSGNLSELYLGVSGRPFKGFNVGAQISYLFGNLVNDTYAMLTSGGTSLFENQLNVRDYRLNFGVQYSHALRGVDRLTVGLTYAPGKDLRGNAKKIYYDSSDESNEPEIAEEHNLKGNYSLPDTWGAGINYEWNRKLMVEVDYTFQPWSKAKYLGFLGDSPEQSFRDRQKLAAGLQYVPNFRGGYFSRVNYRLGAHFANDYLVINKNGLRDYGVTAGFGFPVPQFKTTINLGFAWERRQAHPNPLIKENYFTITLGINVNEMWFRQSKIY